MFYRILIIVYSLLSLIFLLNYADDARSLFEHSQKGRDIIAQYCSLHHLAFSTSVFTMFVFVMMHYYKKIDKYPQIIMLYIVTLCLITMLALVFYFISLVLECVYLENNVDVYLTRFETLGDAVVITAYPLSDFVLLIMLKIDFFLIYFYRTPRLVEELDDDS